MDKQVKAIPDGYTAITPYLVVDGAAAALDFYKKAFGAVETVRMPQPDGKIGHAEMLIGGACVMLADEAPQMGARGPKTIGGSPVSILLYVEDVDTVFKRAIDAGAKEQRPIEDKFYGDRAGSLEDPFGHTWHISTHVEDPSVEEIKRRAVALYGVGQSS